MEYFPWFYCNYVNAWLEQLVCWWAQIAYSEVYTSQRIRTHFIEWHSVLHSGYVTLVICYNHPM